MQESHEKLSLMEERNTREMQYLQQQMTVVRSERERLAGHYSMLKKSLDHTDAETSHFELAISSCENEVDLLEKSIQKVARSTQELWAKIDLNISDQTTHGRNEAASLKNVKKLALETEKKEADMVAVANEISRVKVDVLNVQAHQGVLVERLKELGGDLRQREQLIESYEEEIKTRHHQIGKKQLYVDRLNRQYDEKRKKLEEELGEALEAEAADAVDVQMKALRKKIAAKAAECGMQQKEWLAKQNSIMANAMEQGEISD